MTHLGESAKKPAKAGSPSVGVRSAFPGQATAQGQENFRLKLLKKKNNNNNNNTNIL